MIILLILSIIGITLLINCIKYIKPSESPLIACSLIIIYIYIFSLIGLLEIGAWSVMVLGLISLPISIIIKRKELKVFLHSLINPGYLLFIFILIILYPICRPIVTGAWDEYSHWALVVRNMLLTGHLPQLDGAVTYLSYPPATSLFQYLFMKISTGVEGMMYYAQAILIASCLSMLLKGQSFKKPLYLVMMIALPVLVMIKFSVHNIFNIFTDTIMAVVAISCFVSYYNSKYELIDIIKIAPILFFLCLIRSSAISFAAFVLIIIIVHQIKIHKIKSKNTLYGFIALLTPIVIANLSWQIHLKLAGIVSKSTSLFPLDIPRLTTTIHSFVRAIFLEKLGTVYPPLYLFSSTFAFFIMAIAVFVIMHFVLNKHKQERKLANQMQLTFIVCFVIYSIGLLYTYQCVLTHVEGKKVASFGRYMGTYFIFWVIGIFYLIIDTIHKLNMLKPRRIIATLLCAMIILVVGLLTHPSMLNILGGRRLENVYEKESKEHAYNIQSIVGNKPKVYMIFQKSRGYSFMGTRYQLGTNQTNLGTWSLGKPYSDTDTWTVDISPEDIYQRFLDLDYEYVYVGGGDDQLWNNYDMLFDKPNSDYKVFKVTPDGNYPLTAIIN